MADDIDEKDDNAMDNTLEGIVNEIYADVDGEDGSAEEELAREETEDETLEDTKEIDVAEEVVEETMLDVCEAAGTSGNPAVVKTGGEKLGCGNRGCTTALEPERSRPDSIEDLEFSTT